MCFSASSSLFGFTIGSFLALMLFLRNESFDQVLAFFALGLALIQLVEFLYYVGTLSASDAGKYLFLILWLQILLFAIGGLTFSHSWFFIAYAVFAVILFCSALITLTSSSWTVQKGKSLEWQRVQGGAHFQDLTLFGSWSGFLYLAGILLPLFYLLFTTSEKIGVSLLIAYGLLTLFCTWYFFSNFSSMWCYTAVGFIFLAWFIGIFRPTC